MRPEDPEAPSGSAPAPEEPPPTAASAAASTTAAPATAPPREEPPAEVPARSIEVSFDGESSEERSDGAPWNPSVESARYLEAKMAEEEQPGSSSLGLYHLDFKPTPPTFFQSPLDADGGYHSMTTNWTGYEGEDFMNGKTLRHLFGTRRHYNSAFAFLGHRYPPRNGGVTYTLSERVALSYLCDVYDQYKNRPWTRNEFKSILRNHQNEAMWVNTFSQIAELFDGHKSLTRNFPVEHLSELTKIVSFPPSDQQQEQQQQQQQQLVDSKSDMDRALKAHAKIASDGGLKMRGNQEDGTIAPSQEINDEDEEREVIEVDLASDGSSLPTPAVTEAPNAPSKPTEQQKQHHQRLVDSQASKDQARKERAKKTLSVFQKMREAREASAKKHVSAATKNSIKHRLKASQTVFDRLRRKQKVGDGESSSSGTKNPPSWAAIALARKKRKMFSGGFFAKKLKRFQQDSPSSPNRLGANEVRGDASVVDLCSSDEEDDSGTAGRAHETTRGNEEDGNPKRASDGDNDGDNTNGEDTTDNSDEHLSKETVRKALAGAALDLGLDLSDPTSEELSQANSVLGNVSATKASPESHPKSIARDIDEPKKNTVANSNYHFPSRLHDVLDDAERKGHSHVISWCPTGTSFKIHDTNAIVDVLPQYFRQTKFKSLLRQLQSHGFTRVTSGEDKGRTSHPMFIRGQRSLCTEMKRKTPMPMASKKHYNLVSESGDIPSSGKGDAHLNRLLKDPPPHSLAVTETKKPSKTAPMMGPLNNDEKDKKNLPRRPMSAYNIFFKEQRRQILKTDPRMSCVSLAKLIADRWRELDIGSRVMYEGKASTDSKRYKTEMEVWRAKHGNTSASKDSSPMALLVKAIHAPATGQSPNPSPVLGTQPISESSIVKKRKAVSEPSRPSWRDFSEKLAKRTSEILSEKARSERAASSAKEHPSPNNLATIDESSADATRFGRWGKGFSTDRKRLLLTVLAPESLSPEAIQDEEWETADYLDVSTAFSSRFGGLDLEDLDRLAKGELVVPKGMKSVKETLRIYKEGLQPQREAGSKEEVIEILDDEKGNGEKRGPSKEESESNFQWDGTFQFIQKGREAVDKPVRNPDLTNSVSRCVRKIRQEKDNGPSDDATEEKQDSPDHEASRVLQRNEETQLSEMEGKESVRSRSSSMSSTLQTPLDHDTDTVGTVGTVGAVGYENDLLANPEPKATDKGVFDSSGKEVQHEQELPSTDILRTNHTENEEKPSVLAEHGVLDEEIPPNDQSTTSTRRKHIQDLADFFTISEFKNKEHIFDCEHAEKSFQEMKNAQDEDSSIHDGRDQSSQETNTDEYGPVLDSNMNTGTSETYKQQGSESPSTKQDVSATVSWEPVSWEHEPEESERVESETGKPITNAIVEYEGTSETYKQQGSESPSTKQDVSATVSWEHEPEESERVESETDKPITNAIVEYEGQHFTTENLMPSIREVPTIFGDMFRSILDRVATCSDKENEPPMEIETSFFLGDATLGQIQLEGSDECLSVASKEYERTQEKPLINVSSKQLFVLAVPLIFLSGIFSKLGLFDVSNSIFEGCFRSFLQLHLLGWLLSPVFKHGEKRPVLVGCYSVFMILLASYEASSRTKYTHDDQFYIIVRSLILSISLVITWAWGTILKQEQIWNPRYLLPIVGMLLGNSINGISITLDTITTSLVERQSEVDLYLSFGANQYEAVSSIVANAIQKGSTPTLNMMSVVGIVSIPGMMTGQILGGSNPMVAARYQAMVIFLIALSTLATIVLSSYLTVLSAFCSHRIFRPERYVKNHKRGLARLILGTWGYIFGGSNATPGGSNDALLLDEMNPGPVSKHGFELRPLKRGSVEMIPLVQVSGLSKGKDGNDDTNRASGIDREQSLFQNLSFSVNEGDFFLISGANGIGQSELLRMVAGLSPLEEGSMQFLNRNWNDNYDGNGTVDWRKQIRYVTQAKIQIQGTPRQFIKKIQSFQSWKADDRIDDTTNDVMKHILYHIRQWHLNPECLDKQWTVLSEGESQRILIAIALASRPKILLLDKSTSAMDHDSELAVEASIMDFVEDHEGGVMWVTHDKQQAERMDSAFTNSL